MTIGFGVSEKPEKWCSATVTQSKPNSSAQRNWSKVVCIDRAAASLE
jgi:hypothetical protein